MTKPRVSFCWECGRKLYQGKVHVTMEVEGHERILHKQCAEMIEKGVREPWPEEEEAEHDQAR